MSFKKNFNFKKNIFPGFFCIWVKGGGQIGPNTFLLIGPMLVAK